MFRRKPLDKWSPKRIEEQIVDSYVSSDEAKTGRSALHGDSPTYRAAIVFHQDERLLPKRDIERAKAEGEFRP
jgi:hypothetical protein